MSDISQIMHAVRRFKIPNLPPVVYFLCRGKEVVYVGQSVNFHSRLAYHVMDESKEFTSVYYMKVRRARLLLVERAFIKYYQPEYNREAAQLKPLDRAERSVLGRAGIVIFEK